MVPAASLAKGVDGRKDAKAFNEANDNTKSAHPADIENTRRTGILLEGGQISRRRWRASGRRWRGLFAAKARELLLNRRKPFFLACFELLQVLFQGLYLPEEGLHVLMKGFHVGDGRA